MQGRMRNTNTQFIAFLSTGLISVILLSLGYVWLAVLGSILLAVSALFSSRRFKLGLVGCVSFYLLCVVACFLVWFYLRPPGWIWFVAWGGTIASEIHHRRGAEHNV
jgi:hypothetical protein